MPQSSLRQSSRRGLLAIHRFDVGHLYSKFGSLFNRRKVKGKNGQKVFRLKYSAHDSFVSFQTRFVALNVSPHFYQFRWKKKGTSILLHSLEKTVCTVFEKMDSKSPT